MRRRRRSKNKRLGLKKARAAAWRRAVDLQYMGLSKRDRRRIAEIGLRRWMNEAADAQALRMAKAKRRAAQKRDQAA